MRSNAIHRAIARAQMQPNQSAHSAQTKTGAIGSCFNVADDLLVHLRLQVILQAHCLDQAQLSFQPVDVFFF
ncbi:hypothetical protein SAMN05216264_101488 [Pseudomonas marincola]|nr:hypothetical protein SAMN05216264_101488 [Pseudomonas marincola]